MRTTSWPVRHGEHAAGEEGAPGSGLGQRGGGHGAKLVMETTEGQLPSNTTRCCRHELNISDKMTLKSVCSREGKAGRAGLPVAYGTASRSASTRAPRRQMPRGQQRGGSSSPGRDRQAWRGTGKRPPQASTVALTGRGEGVCGGQGAGWDQLRVRRHLLRPGGRAPTNLGGRDLRELPKVPLEV